MFVLFLFNNNFGVITQEKKKKVFSIFLLFIFIVVNFFGFNINTAHAADPWKTGWTAWGYRVKVTINASQVPSTQTNFPVYVNLANLPAGFFSNVKSDGSDIRVTNSSGTELARQVVVINTGASTGELWFNANSISDSAYYYIYYGNSGASEPAANSNYGSQNVWNSNFKYVTHLKDGSNLDANDVTSNGYTATNGAATATIGQIDGGASMNGLGSEKINTNYNQQLNDFTFSAWFKSTGAGAGSYERILDKDYADGMVICRDASSANTWGVYAFGLNKAMVTLTDGVWHQITVTRSGSTIYVYGDGGAVTNSMSPYSSALSTKILRIGNAIAAYSWNAFKGTIDEVKVSNIARSADWIKIEYNNQNSTTGFYTVTGPETATTVPDAPTGLTPTAGNEQVNLSWTAPANNGGSAITDYVIEYKLTSDSIWTQFGHDASSSTSIIVASVGLVNGSSYDFRVFAVNVVGPSATASNIVSSTPATVPSAPAKGTATRGNSSASIAFTPPNNGGSAITGYTVTSSPGSFTGTGLTSPIVVSGLTNGTAYTFTVTATNSAGTGPASTASNSVTPATVPGAPTAVTPTYGDKQVSLLWSAPASNGGSAITDYVIEYKLTSALDIPANWQIYADAQTPTIVATVISGLVNGTSYDFRISAVNAVGSGSPSSPLVSSTPKTIPSAPTITSAVSGDMQVTVNFTPLSNPTVAPWYGTSGWTYRKK